MTRLLACVTALATLGIGVPSHVVSAQSRADDRKYCDALVDLYRAYVSDPNRRNVRAVNAQDEVAISKCQSGDAAAGIPTLEKALTDSKISLPRR